MPDSLRGWPMMLSLRGLRHVLSMLLTVLVLVQTVGVLHRAVHAQQSAGATVQVPSAEVTNPASLLAAIWGEHSNSAECQLFDQTCPDVLHIPFGVWAAVLPISVGVTAVLQERFALFERFYAARGPPAALP